MKRLFSISVLAVLLMACCIPGMADVLDWSLSGTLGSADLHAEAIFNSGLWTYTYTAYITGVTTNVTGLTIANLDKLAFSDPTNDKGFTNPSFTGTDSIIWTKGNVSANNGPITFSFKSVYAPKVDNVTLWGGLKSAAGKTLTLSTVPEPSSLLAICTLSAGGVIGLLRRRRR